MNIKKIASTLIVLFLVSFGSSYLTRLALKKNAPKPASWQKELNLSQDQAVQFARMEQELNRTMKDIETEDAKSKIYLCAHLGEPSKSGEIKETAKNLTLAYQKRQEKIAGTLSAIAGVLTPEQRKIFSHKLMQEVCVACRDAKSTDQCLCGMCKT